MKKRIAILLVICMILCLLPAGVFAADTLSDVKVETDSLNGQVVITAVAAKATEAVRLLVLKPEKKLADITAGNLKEVIAWQEEKYPEQTASGAPFIYTFSFVLPDGAQDGTYALFLYGGNGFVYPSSFYFLPAAVLARELNELDMLTQESAVSAWLKENEEKFDLRTLSEYPLLETLSEEQQSRVFQQLMDTDFSISADYANLNDRKSHLLAVLKDSITTGAEIDTWILSFASAQTSVEVKAVIDGLESYYTIDKSTYTKIKSTNQSKVFERLLGQDLKTAGSIIEAFEKAAEETYRAQGNDSSGNGSSGGGANAGSGGSRGGGSSIKIDPVPTPTAPPEFEPDEMEEEIFSDIGNVVWAKEAITFLKNQGSISGVTETEFVPDAAVTREQFVKMVTGAFGILETEAEPGFADVPEDAWYTQAIAAAKAAGVVTGDGSTFGVGLSITRQDAAVILKRVMTNTGASLTISNAAEFTDAAEIADYAREAVLEMAGSGILSGLDDGAFGPNQNLTRAQAAVMIYNTLKQTVK